MNIIEWLGQFKKLFLDEFIAGIVFAVLMIVLIIFIYLVISKKSRKSLLAKWNQFLTRLSGNSNLNSGEPKEDVEEKPNSPIVSPTDKVLSEESNPLIDKEMPQDLEEQLKPLVEKLVEERLKSLPAQVNQSVEERLKSLPAQVNRLNQDPQKNIQLGAAFINNKLEELPEKITQQVSQSLEGKFEELPEKITQQVSQSLENKFPLEETSFDQSSNDAEKDDDEDDNISDNSDEKPELSQFAKAMITEFNERDNFGQMYASNRLTLSMNPKAFAGGYKPEEVGTGETAKYSDFDEDKGGIFWAIKEHQSNKHLLVLNQDRLTPQQFKSTLGFSTKHLSQVFDGVEKYDGNKHEGVKIIYPAIVEEKGERLELKTRGELDFY